MTAHRYYVKCNFVASLKICQSWDHQILRTQIRKFEDRIIYKNRHIQYDRKLRRLYKKTQRVTLNRCG